MSYQGHKSRSQITNGLLFQKQAAKVQKNLNGTCVPLRLAKAKLF